MRQLIAIFTLLSTLFLTGCDLFNDNPAQAYNKYLKNIESLFQRNSAKILKQISDSNEPSEFSEKAYKMNYNPEETSSDEEKIIRLVNKIWIEFCNRNNPTCQKFYNEMSRIIEPAESKDKNSDFKLRFNVREVNYDWLFSTITSLGEDLATQCVTGSKGKFYYNDGCPINYENLCSDMLFRDGRAYVKAVDDKFKVHEVELEDENSYEVFLSETEGVRKEEKRNYDVQNSYKYNVCKAYGLAIKNKPNDIATVYGKPDWFESIGLLNASRMIGTEKLHLVDGVPILSNNMIFICGELSPKALDGAENIKFSAPRIYTGLMNAQLSCKKTIEEYCKLTGQIGDKMFKTVRDRSCGERKFFMEDIEQSANNDRTVTLAEKEEMITNIRKLFSWCKDAIDMGYSWEVQWPKCN